MDLQVKTSFFIKKSVYSFVRINIGFRNAPVTKFLVPIVGGCSALAAVCNLKPHMALQLSHLGIENGQVDDNRNSSSCYNRKNE